MFELLFKETCYYRGVEETPFESLECPEVREPVTELELEFYQLLADSVCGELKIARCLVKPTLRGCQSYYRPDEKTIYIGKGWGEESKLGRKCDVFLHELAHHLEMRKGRGKHIHKGYPHGHFFVKALVWLVDRYYEDRTNYPWSQDYKIVGRLYRQRFEGKPTPSWPN